MNEDRILSIQEATIFHHYKTILNDVNLDLNKGEFIYLIGKTGSGKSSLLRTIYCDIPLKMGEIIIDGESISKIKRNQLPYLRRIFQLKGLFIQVLIHLLWMEIGVIFSLRIRLRSSKM